MPNHPIRLFSNLFLTFRIILISCMFLVINELNAALVVNAGPDQVVTPGTYVELDGSVSRETDGIIASYHWYQVRGPQVSIDNSRNVIANFIMPENAELEFTLKLVSDSGEVATDRITVRTDPFINLLPQANAGADQTINAGETVQLDGSGSSDSDGSIVRYSWYQNRGPAVDL
ncbi:MAG: PKD domain-containing protein, partial [Candidatus Thiodiazotropha sp.]